MKSCISIIHTNGITSQQELNRYEVAHISWRSALGLPRPQPAVGAWRTPITIEMTSYNFSFISQFEDRASQELLVIVRYLSEKIVEYNQVNETEFESSSLYYVDWQQAYQDSICYR